MSDHGRDAELSHTGRRAPETLPTADPQAATTADRHDAATADRHDAATASPTWARQETLPPTAPPVGGTGTPLGSQYLLDEVIGTGATGRVWRGRRRDDQSPVAVKVLREEFSAEPDAVVRFLRERTTLRALTHPHLVRVHDLVAEGDTFAIVMELVDGEDLRALVRRGALPPSQIPGVLHQVASALAAVHAAGVVHRDIKPENVLVDWPSGAAAAPRARLTDFGLAWAGGGPLVTRASQLVGTPAYVAPELVAGRPAGQPSDVYALGIMAYELLAGRRPFHAEHTAALLRAHLDTDPPRPPGLPDEMWQLLSECLAKPPDARPTAKAAAARFAALPGHSVAPPAQMAPPLPSGLNPAPAPLAAPVPSGANPAQPAPPPVSAPPSGQSAHTTPPSPPTHTAAPDGSGVMSRTGLASGVAETLPTTGATRPSLPPPPGPPPKRRRRWLLVTAIVACVVIGLGAGIWAGQPDAPKPSPSASAGPPVQQYFLEVFATTPAPGKVRLEFTDKSSEPGFVSYTVFRDNYKIATVGAGEQVPPYLVTGVDTKTSHCYSVLALIKTNTPPPSPAPKCKQIVADGKTS